jgi:hypothetical protein
MTERGHTYQYDDDDGGHDYAVLDDVLCKYTVGHTHGGNGTPQAASRPGPSTPLCIAICRRQPHSLRCRRRRTF